MKEVSLAHMLIKILFFNLILTASQSLVFYRVNVTLNLFQHQNPSNGKSRFPSRLTIPVRLFRLSPAR